MKEARIPYVLLPEGFHVYLTEHRGGVRATCVELSAWNVEAGTGAEALGQLCDRVIAARNDDHLRATVPRRPRTDWWAEYSIACLACGYHKECHWPEDAAMALIAHEASPGHPTSVGVRQVADDPAGQ